MTAKPRRGLTEQAADAAVDQACRMLHLPTVRAQFPDLAEAAAREQISYRGFLAELLMAECDDRARRRSERQIRAAGFRRDKSLRAFDFTAKVNVALRAGPGITAAASADPFSGEIFWTGGDRACLRSGGADAGLAPSPGTQLVDVNLDPPFPNAPGFRAVSLLGDEAFTARFRPRVVSTTLALAWVAAGR
jgi:IstB-like ATP binding protein